MERLSDALEGSMGADNLMMRTKERPADVVTTDAFGLPLY